MGNDPAMIKKNLFINGALILTAAMIVTKILSAIYRIPFQNIVGDVGFYIYQQVYPFYGIAIALATTGFPVIISKYYADAISNGYQNIQKVLVQAIIAISILCLIVFAVLFIGSDIIAGLMGDENLSPLIQVSAFSFLLVPIISYIRGVFQGAGQMTPTAISQVGEQFVRVVLILIIAIVLFDRGHSLYEIGQGAMIASIIGSLFGAVLLAVYFYRRSKEPNEQVSRAMPSAFPSMKSIFFQGLAVCISGLTLVLFQLSDAFQVYSLLVQQGIPEETAKLVKGVFDRGQPLLQFGLILATALSLSIVPVITSAKNYPEQLTDYIRLSFQICIVIGLAASVGLILIMKPLNIMLFMNNNGTKVLQILAIAVFLASVNATAIAILQGLGHTYFPAFVVLIGLATKVLFNWVLVKEIGIAGAALSTNAALLIMLIILRQRIRQITKEKILHSVFYSQLFFSLSIMAMTVFFILIIIDLCIPGEDLSRLGAAVQAIGTSLAGAAVYLFSNFRSGMFARDKLIQLPFSSRLQNWLNRKI